MSCGGNCGCDGGCSERGAEPLEEGADRATHCECESRSQPARGPFEPSDGVVARAPGVAPPITRFELQSELRRHGLGLVSLGGAAPRVSENGRDRRLRHRERAESDAIGSLVNGAIVPPFSARPASADRRQRFESGEGIASYGRSSGSRGARGFPGPAAPHGGLLECDDSFLAVRPDGTALPCTPPAKRRGDAPAFVAPPEFSGERGGGSDLQSAALEFSHATLDRERAEQQDRRERAAPQPISELPDGAAERPSGTFEVEPERVSTCDESPPGAGGSRGTSFPTVQLGEGETFRGKGGREPDPEPEPPGLVIAAWVDPCPCRCVCLPPIFPALLELGRWVFDWVLDLVQSEQMNRTFSVSRLPSRLVAPPDSRIEQIREEARRPKRLPYSTSAGVAPGVLRPLEVREVAAIGLDGVRSPRAMGKLLYPGLAVDDDFVGNHGTQVPVGPGPGHPSMGRGIFAPRHSYLAAPGSLPSGIAPPLGSGGLVTEGEQLVRERPDGG